MWPVWDHPDLQIVKCKLEHDWVCCIYVWHWSEPVSQIEQIFSEIDVCKYLAHIFPLTTQARFIVIASLEYFWDIWWDQWRYPASVLGDHKADEAWEARAAFLATPPQYPVSTPLPLSISAVSHFRSCVGLTAIITTRIVSTTVQYPLTDLDT